MVNEQMYEQTTMPYDAYYAAYPPHDSQGNIYDYYPPYYPWTAYQPYPMMPYPPYPSYPPYVPNNDYSQRQEYASVATMNEVANEQEQVTANIADSKVLQQFMNDSGQVDIQKMLQTVGQFADTVQQVSPVIKQLNELVRSFRT